MTVRNEVAPDDLGVVLHEHLLSDLLREYRSSGTLNDETLAGQELAMFATAGGGTVVDLTTDEIGRDPAALRRISESALRHDRLWSGRAARLGCGPRPERGGRVDQALPQMLVRPGQEGAQGARYVHLGVRPHLATNA